MAARNMKVTLADETLTALEILGGQHGGASLGLSGSVNLAVHILPSMLKGSVPITPAELLDCCTVLGGAVALSASQTPTPGAIRDAMAQAGRTLAKIGLTVTPMHWAAIILAARQYPTDAPLGDILPPGDCASPEDWARQWVAP